MRKLRGICTFVEFNESTPADRLSIRDYISDVPQPDEEKIVAYLGGGVGIAGRGGYLRDVLNPSFVGLTSDTLTDGIYVWASYLPYYVKKYHLKIPDAVVAHMRANDWTIPGADTINTHELMFE